MKTEEIRRTMNARVIDPGLLEWMAEHQAHVDQLKPAERVLYGALEGYLRLCQSIQHYNVGSEISVRREQALSLDEREHTLMKMLEAVRLKA